MAPESRISFYRGAALDETHFATLASFDKHDSRGEPYYPETSVDLFDLATRSWTRVAVRDWFGVSVARYSRASDPVVGFAALSVDGDVLIWDGTPREERVLAARTAPMTKLRQTVGGLYALGAAGFLFRRSDVGEWSVLSESYFLPEYLTMSSVERFMAIGGIRTKEEYRSLSPQEEMRIRFAKLAREAPFYDIDGFGADDLYLAGQNGALMHFDGVDMHQLDSGVQSNLNNVIGRQGEIYIAGAHRGSVILKGRRETGFGAIFHEPVKRLWLDSMAFNGESILIGDPEIATGGIWQLDIAGSLRKLPQPASPIWKVDVVDGVIWALEAKALSRFDGARWERFVHPEA